MNICTIFRTVSTDTALRAVPRRKRRVARGGVAAAGFDTATNTQSDPLGAAPDR